jgi:hypothetical protein
MAAVSGVEPAQQWLLRKLLSVEEGRDGSAYVVRPYRTQRALPSEFPDSATHLLTIDLSRLSNRRQE